MAKRKKSPTRDPSAEPFASPYSDEEPNKLDTPATLAEIERASRKPEAARQQRAGGLKLFVDPNESDSSAGATVSIHLSAVKALAQFGKQSKASLSKGGEKRARQRKDEANAIAETICSEATRLLANDHAPREISGILKDPGALRKPSKNPARIAHGPVGPLGETQEKVTQASAR